MNGKKLTSCLEKKPGHISNWMLNDTWELPPEGVIGCIRNVDTNMVLSLMNNATVNGTKVIEEIFDENSIGQKWLIGKANNEGYFDISNPSSGKILTSTRNYDVVEITGKL